MKFRLGLENHVPRSYRITLKSCISSVKKFLTWPKKDADINKNYQTLKPISIFSKTAFSLRVRNHKRNPSGRELGYIKSFDICIIFQLTILQGKTTWTFQYNIFFLKKKETWLFLIIVYKTNWSFAMQLSHIKIRDIWTRWAINWPENEKLLLSTNFIVKFELVFLLTYENVYSKRFHYQANRKNISFSKTKQR